MKLLEPKRVFPPSLQLACPRSGCGLQMTASHQEDFLVLSCSGCGYQVKEISGELKADYQASLFERTAQRRRQ